MKVVITGTPGTGKSTLISFLSQMGFAVVPEGATAVMNATGIREPHKLPDNLRSEFRNQVVLHYESGLQNNVGKFLTFFDRSLIDTVAYAEFEGRRCPQEILEKCSTKMLYDRVFVLQNFPSIYEQTDLRRMPENEARELGHIIIDTYRKLGYAVNVITDTNFVKRIDVLLSELGFSGPILLDLIARAKYVSFPIKEDKQYNFERR